MVDEETNRHIIIDNGTSYIKTGISGEVGPRSLLPTLIGYPKYVHIKTIFCWFRCKI